MYGTTEWAGDEDEAKAAFTRAAIGFVILGIILRLVRYLQNYPMWCDETMLAANLLDRRWIELVQPLDYRQICPMGLLALEWIIVHIYGFSEPSLRLIPVLCAIASVPLFHFLARKVLGRGTCATLLAVALFAVSEPPIRYAAEVKPYSADLLASLVVLSLTVTWLQTPGRVRQLWALAAIMPLVVTTSLPSVFLIGTIAVVGACEVFSRWGTRPLTAYIGFLASAALAIAGMAAVRQYHASPADRNYLIDFWAGAFPPSWNDPSALAGWLLRAHTGPLFAYPLGANRLPWLTTLIFGCFIVGIVLLGRRNPRVVVLFALPFPLGIVAAALRRYPYGMSARVAQFLVPSTLLLASAGLAWLCARLRPSILARWATPALAVALVGIGLCRLGRDLGNPCRTPWDRTSREFARWFWNELAADAELVCVRTDLGIAFRPGQWAYDGADQYLCFQRIYSRRHQQKRPPRWDAVSRTRPLRCVLFNRMPSEVPAFLNWIETHRSRYTLREVRTYPATRGSPAEPAQTYVVCEFTPTLHSPNAGRTEQEPRVPNDRMVRTPSCQHDGMHVARAGG
jgi:hypothetical protein